MDRIDIVFLAIVIGWAIMAIIIAFVFFFIDAIIPYL